ncbi:GATA zinc finger domain-containing protein 10-like isoform X2 [Stomoxys calcitrans]|uniref:GATA zinc finger domain-containing protein 10-like isoform X2 n=1 Tax=Stomoxys calcitrans TaxID=35570 RepID=UPI0027E2AEE4|nr:GATA zinc finger domain-containing protein 10-like isoform X2 [Stomoxys calcitrans]
MYKQEPFSRRGSLRSLRSAPLLSTVLESTLSLTRIHPIASLELPGLDYAIQSQSAIIHERRELGTSLRGIATITAGSTVPPPQTRLGPQASVRETKRSKQPQRALSRKLKPHLVADTVKQYISRAQRPAKGSQEQQPNMEFLRGVYAFMQVSRSSVDYHQGYESITTTSPLAETNASEQQATEVTTITSARGIHNNNIALTTASSSANSNSSNRRLESSSLNTNSGLEEKKKRSSSKTPLKKIKESLTEEEHQRQQKQQQQQQTPKDQLQYHQQKMLNKRKHHKQQQQ